MSLSIRMARGGNKHRPFFRIVVQERSAPRDGRFVERLGSYNPLLADNKSQINMERAIYWMDVGAQPSQRVSRLLDWHGVKHARILPVGTRKHKPKSEAALASAMEAPTQAAAPLKAAAPPQAAAPQETQPETATAAEKAAEEQPASQQAPAKQEAPAASKEAPAVSTD